MSCVQSPQISFLIWFTLHPLSGNLTTEQKCHSLRTRIKLSTPTYLLNSPHPDVRTWCFPDQLFQLGSRTPPVSTNLIALLQRFLVYILANQHWCHSYPDLCPTRSKPFRVWWCTRGHAQHSQPWLSREHLYCLGYTCCRIRHLTCLPYFTFSHQAIVTGPLTAVEEEAHQRRTGTCIPLNEFDVSRPHFLGLETSASEILQPLFQDHSFSSQAWVRSAPLLAPSEVRALLTSWLTSSTHWFPISPSVTYSLLFKLIPSK